MAKELACVSEVALMRRVVIAPEGRQLESCQRKAVEICMKGAYSKDILIGS